MPFIVEPEPQQFVTLPDDENKTILESETPSVVETFGAAFRQENSFVSAAAKGFGISPQFQPEEGYDPYEDDLTGYELFAENFIESTSPGETGHIKMMIDRELEDRKTLSAAGGTGFVAQMAAGITDPIYLPLMATGIGQIKMGANAAKAFGQTAAIGAFSEIPAEAAKQATQETRSIEESLINIGGAALLSGILGAGISKLSNAQFNELSKKADDILHAPEDANLSVGAAQVVQNSLEDLELVNVGKLEQWGVSPLVRTTGKSPSLATKQIVNSMMETPLISKGNIEGKATAPEGGAVETRIKLWRRPLSESIEELDASYLKYRQGLGNTRRIINDYVLRNRQSKLTPQEFRIEVGKAMRRGDKHDIPEVAEASQTFRQKLFDPMKDAAIAEKLLPPDVKTSTAVSYLTRVYNTKKIIARSNDFDEITRKWLNGLRSSSLRDVGTVIQKATDIVGETPIDRGDLAGSLGVLNRKLRKSIEQADESLNVQVDEVAELRDNIKGIKDLLSKSTVSAKTAQAVENEIQKEFNVSFDRFLKFKPDEKAEEFLSAVEGVKKKVTAIDKSINDLGIKENTLRSEAEKQLNRFLSDRARGLIKREKAFGQNFTRIENQLSKIRGDIAGKKGQKELLLDNLTAKIDNLNLVKKGDKSKAAELKVSINRLKTKLKKSAEKTDINIKKIDEAEADIRLKRESLTQAIAKRRDIETQLKESKKVARSLSSQLSEASVTDAEIDAITVSLRENITGVASGRLPYDVKLTERGPLKERVYTIQDELIEDFLESDIDLVARQYQRTMAPDVELNRMFGDVTGEKTFDDIDLDYENLRKAATTEKERTQLNKQQESDKLDMAAMWDRLRGTYRTPDDPNAFFIRAGRTIRDVNFMRMLGGMTISAIPDLARPIAVNGLRPVARSLKALAFAPQEFKMSRLEGKKAAVGLDMTINSKVASMAEISDIYSRGTAFERGLRSTSDAFSKITLMSQWNTVMKQFSGVATQDRLLEQAVKFADGTINKNNLRRMASAGIGEGMAKRIATQFKKHGDEGTINLSNGHKWDDRDALETFRAAVLKDVDRTIITPGEGEKPLWTSSETGKLIFQFKTFASTAHHKILLADLQHRDLQALNGFLISVGLGSMTYGLKQFVADRPISDDPAKIIVESLDRSGAFGYFWDINNMIEKGTRGNFGVNSLLGAPPMSRYASRNMMGAMLGPSFGTATDVLSITGAIGEEAGAALGFENAKSGAFTQKELRKVRKLLPGQNLFYMRRLLNELEKEAGRGLPE